MGGKNIKRILRSLPEQLSIGALALLVAVVSRGSWLLADFLGASKGKSLSRSLAEINQLKTFSDYYEEIKNLKIKTNSVRTILWRLEQKGMIKKDGGKIATTALGRQTVDNFTNKLKESDWDGKWRIIFFDVPESRRSQRKWLNFNLTSHGYKPLQKSVFLGKNPLNEDLLRAILDRDLYKSVRIITVLAIDDDSFLV